MKILAASDIHGNKTFIDNLAKKAEKENVEMVVLCGDLTFSEISLEGIIGPFKKAKKKVLLIPGNHETLASADFLSSLYGKYYVKNLHGYYFCKDDIGFFGCGGGNVGLFSLDEDEIKYTLTKAYRGVSKSKKKVMLTHIPPFGTKTDKILFGSAGSTSIKNAIEKIQPDFCLCGHIHECFEKEDMIGKTRVINLGPKGKIINI